MLLALLVCSALISGSEVAFFSLDRNQLKDLEEEESHSASRILSLREKPRRLLATILITNNLVNIGIVILSYYLFQIFLPSYVFYAWGDAVNTWPFPGWFTPEEWAAFFSFMITIVGITFLLVLFGEVVPKIYANLHNVAFARLMSIPVKLLMPLLAPLSSTMVKWGNALEKKLGTESVLGANKEDIDRAIDLAVAKDKDSEIEAGILKSIVSFNDVAVKQIMRSRMDIVALETGMTHQERREIVRETGSRRLLVP